NDELPMFWFNLLLRRYTENFADSGATRNAKARRSSPQVAPPPAVRQTRTGSQRQAARRSATPEAVRRFNPPVSAQAHTLRRTGRPGKSRARSGSVHSAARTAQRRRRATERARSSSQRKG